MPKLPRNCFKRGRSFYYRAMVDGRVRRLSLGSDYQEALVRLRSLKRDGGVASGPAVTLGEAAGQWLTSYVPTARTGKGPRLATQRVRDYIVPILGHRPLDRITGEHVRSLRLQLERLKLAPQSVRHVLSDLRCLLNWCRDAGLMDGSPFPRRVLPRIQERPPDRLSDEELSHVLSVPEPYGFVVRLALGTGLRWGELVRAQASDCRMDTLTVALTKSAKVRRVPIHPDLAAEIRGRVGRLVPFLHADSFNLQVRRHSGVTRFHVHQLRHTFACRWLEVGGSLAALQELLGHASIVTTQRYGRLSDAHVQAEARRIQGRLVTEVVTPCLREGS